MLGFEGRYRVVDNGRSQLETLRQRLLLILRNARGQYAAALSPHWQDAPILNKVRRLPIPLWVFAVLAAALGFLSFLGLQWSLGDRSDKLFADVIKIKPPTVQISAPQIKREPVKTDRIAPFLAPEIRENLLTVRDEADRSVIVLRGDGLFESGADAIRSQYLLCSHAWPMRSMRYRAISWSPDIVIMYRSKPLNTRPIGSCPRPVPMPLKSCWMNA